VGVTIYPILYWLTRSATSAETMTGMESHTVTVTPGSQETRTASAQKRAQQRITPLLVEST
jgi:hypothetical protein